MLVLPDPPLVVGCVDTPAVDATRPYGLLLRHFHEITRIPPLRYRLDEVGDIAWSILRRISPRRSLRLSLQVVRVLEGYAWPGNISELEDVLRYVAARKPLGEVQPPDLPSLCFKSQARRMSMLEAAQCDAIIQALYESNGNRYKAAAMLGIARSSLYRKIDAFGISLHRVKAAGPHRDPAARRFAGSARGDHDLQRLVGRGVLEHVVGLVDLAERERVGAHLLGRDPPARHHLEQRGDRDRVDQPGAPG